MIHQLVVLWMALAGLAFSTPAAAQYASDIDIYGIPVSSVDTPNVLIVLDNTANWSPMFTREIQAMVNTFNTLPTGKFNLGLMLFTETGGGNSGADGGYVRAAVRRLDTDYRDKLTRLLTSLDVNADKSNGGKVGLTMMEAYYYFAGLTPLSGNNKAKTDYHGNNNGTEASRTIYQLSGNALNSVADTPYRSPVVGGCAHNYIIYISNGAAQDNSSDESTASARLGQAHSALGMTRPADITGLSPSGSQSNQADEWTRFMRASPQAVTTYTLDVDPITTGQGPGWSALMSSMARRSGGDYFRIDSSLNSGAQIQIALLDIFNKIQAVSSVFASSSLPVSVNARGTYLNQVFMGMFQPEGDSRPRWQGNLKQYSFAYDPATDTLSLADSRGQGAINGATGFISPSAVSYWSTTSTYWINSPRGTPKTGSDSPDGEVVEKGGAAQGLRTTYVTSQAARKLYVCLACAANTNLSTNPASQFTIANSALTTTTLGVATATERDSLINWVRGTDNASDEAGPGGAVTVRPSAHGDVLHSRPAVVNYGGATGVVVFYGANDGLLHAINGNQTGTGAGRELWGLVLQEQAAKLKRLRTNSPPVRLSTTVVGSSTSEFTPQPRDYFVDGPIEIYQKVSSSGSTQRAILYATLRRGGRMIYAIDVTDPNQPIFLWSRKGLSSDLPILGQTWSAPKVARVKGRTNPVVVMGAGYDNAAEDTTPSGTTTMGNAVLVLDAFDGTLVKQFNTLSSVAADVALVDSDVDGYVDRGYAADVGGNIYRIDFETVTATAVDTWGSYRLASLGGAGARKFLFPPDVVLTRNYAAVMAGSGDREKPLVEVTSDSFFTVYDTRVVKGTPGGVFTAITPASLGQVGTNQSMTSGCFIPMATNGEKIVNAPLTVAGVTYFSTNRPAPTTAAACSANLGVAKVYSAPLFCKVAISQTLVGGGLPPSLVTGVVELTYQPIDTSLPPAKKWVPFIIGAPNVKQSAIEGSKVTPTIPSARRRTYWYRENAR